MRTSLALTPAHISGVPCLYAGQALTGLERAVALGYDAVELHVRDTEADETKNVVRCVVERKIPVSALGTGQAAVVDGLTLTSPDPEVRKRALDRLRRHMDLAASLGALVIVGSMQGRFSTDPAVQAEQAVRWPETLADLGKEAAERGTVVVLEPLNRYETNVVNTAADAVSLLQTVSGRGLGLLLDTFHMNIEEVDMGAAVRRGAPYLRIVHLADSHRGAPGTGHTNFEPIFAALRAIGYTGWLSAEIQPRGDDDAAARQALAMMRRWSALEL